MDVTRQESAPVLRTTIVTLGCFVLTLAVALVPGLRFAYEDRDGKIAIETAGGMIACLAAALLFARYARTRQLRDLLLSHAMGLLALGGLLLVAVPGALSGSGADVSTWAPLLSRLGAAVLVAAAAAVGDRVARRSFPLRREVALLVAFVVGVNVAVWLLSSHLPDLIVVWTPAGSSTDPRFDSHPLLLVAQVVNLVCFAYAAVAFVLRSVADDFGSWLGTAFVLGAFSRVHYLLFPSAYTPYLYTGDLLRVGFFLLLLVGCVRELQAHWRGQVESAAEVERRRLARDLHDGVMQELGYLRSQASFIVDPSVRARVLGATERGLDESRRALRTLVAEVPSSTPDAVRDAVCDVGDRYDVPVSLDVADSFREVDGEAREAIVRIAREAVSNAVRHGAPSSVHVSLGSGFLSVRDDGSGFEMCAGRVNGTGFGLTSMRDRAEGLGGCLEVDSAPGRGTEVRVRWR